MTSPSSTSCLLKLAVRLERALIFATASTRKYKRLWLKIDIDSLSKRKWHFKKKDYIFIFWVSKGSAILQAVDETTLLLEVVSNRLIIRIDLCRELSDLFVRSVPGQLLKSNMNSMISRGNYEQQWSGNLFRVVHSCVLIAIDGYLNHQ